MFVKNLFSIVHLSHPPLSLHTRALRAYAKNKKIIRSAYSRGDKSSPLRAHETLQALIISTVSSFYDITAQTAPVLRGIHSSNWWNKDRYFFSHLQPDDTIFIQKNRLLFLPYYRFFAFGCKIGICLRKMLRTKEPSVNRERRWVNCFKHKVLR